MVYKIVSLISSLGIMFCNCGCTFAGKGDPLQEHKEYFDLIRKEFGDIEDKSKVSDYPVIWEHKPNYLFWTDDYRTVVVYNIPYLINHKTSDDDNNFVQATAKALIDSQKAAISAEKIAKTLAVKTTKKFIEIFKDEYKKELTSDSQLISSLANFLGETDEKIVVDACLGAIGMRWACIAGHVVSVAALQSGFLDALVVAHPIAGLTLSATLDLFCYFTGKSRFEMERTKNYATLLHGVWNMLQNNPEKVMNSNVLVTAIDKRDFYVIFRHNAFRRDDGAWCNFTKIGNLKCAPLAKDCGKGKLVSTYLDIYRRIMTDKHLDLDKLQVFINTGNFGPLSSSLESNESQTEEDDSKSTKIMVDE